MSFPNVAAAHLILFLHINSSSCWMPTISDILSLPLPLHPPTIQQLQRISNWQVLQEGSETPRDVTYSDGSRATISGSKILGRFATVMDAEMLGVAMAWRFSEATTRGSQAAIGRMMNLESSLARLWVEEQLVPSEAG